MADNDNPTDSTYFHCKNYAVCKNNWECADEYCKPCKAASTGFSQANTTAAQEATASINAATIARTSVVPLPPSVKSLRLKVVELVGLMMGNNGRTCESHAICGKTVEIGDQLKLYKGSITFEVEEMVPVPVPHPLPIGPLPEGTHVKKKRGRKKKVITTMELKLVTRTVETIEARKWINASAGCLVGFVSKTFVSIYGDSLVGRVVEVSDLSSEFEIDQIRSETLNGIARVTVLQ
jgi:hypothetical protein